MGVSGDGYSNLLYIFLYLFAFIFLAVVLLLLVICSLFVLLIIWCWTYHFCNMIRSDDDRLLGKSNVIITATTNSILHVIVSDVFVSLNTMNVRAIYESTLNCWIVTHDNSEKWLCQHNFMLQRNYLSANQWWETISNMKQLCFKIDAPLNMCYSGPQINKIIKIEMHSFWCFELWICFSGGQFDQWPSRTRNEHRKKIYSLHVSRSKSYLHNWTDSIVEFFIIELMSNASRFYANIRTFYSNARMQNK